jgi:hypothetical protein
MGENEPEEIKWITAVAAVSLLSPLYENVASAQQVLVNYAGAGLIRTHARRLTVKRVTTLEGINRTDDNIFVDSSFWEAFADGQAQGIRWLWSAVKIAHPGRLLPRKLVEPLVEGRPKGRPRGN